MTPRMIEVLNEIHDKIGYYALVRNPKLGKIIFSKIAGAKIDMTANSIVAEFVIWNGETWVTTSTAICTIESIRDAKEAAERMNELWEKQSV